MNELLPRPTVQFRRRSWREFQRALDPLGPPRPLPPRRASDSSLPRSSRLSKSPGETFEPDHTQFVRLNFATSTRILDGMLERMVAAVRQNRR